MENGTSDGSPLSELVRLSVEHIVDEPLAAKVEELSGRGTTPEGARTPPVSCAPCGSVSGSERGARAAGGGDVRS
jgi:hypothetical protein